MGASLRQAIIHVSDPIVGSKLRDVIFDIEIVTIVNNLFTIIQACIIITFHKYDTQYFSGLDWAYESSITKFEHEIGSNCKVSKVSK